VTRPLRESTPESAARERQEREWIERVRAGDGDAFEAMFRAFYSQLAAFAYRYTRSRSDAEEIVHDVMARMWERRDRLEVRDQLRTYLYTAVRNDALNRIRHGMVERRWRERVVAEHHAAPVAAVNDAESRLAQADLAAALERTLARLPDRCRVAVTLRWRHQLSYAEVAEAMGISVKTVEVYVHRGLAALRESYESLKLHL
jgi:RNA polymerase sigma-70 factor (ECF subfamily)